MKCVRNLTHRVQDKPVDFTQDPSAHSLRPYSGALEIERN